MQVTKQVFDIGELFNVVKNLKMVKRTHAAILKQDTISQAVEDIHFDQHHAKELSDVKIEKWPVLNRLKAISIEAFHYWKALENL